MRGTAVAAEQSFGWIWFVLATDLAFCIFLSIGDETTTGRSCCWWCVYFARGTKSRARVMWICSEFLFTVARQFNFCLLYTLVWWRHISFSHGTPSRTNAHTHTHKERATNQINYITFLQQRNDNFGALIHLAQIIPVTSGLSFFMLQSALLRNCSGC